MHIQLVLSGTTCPHFATYLSHLATWSVPVLRSTLWYKVGLLLHYEVGGKAVPGGPSKHHHSQLEPQLVPLSYLPILYSVCTQSMRNTATSNTFIVVLSSHYVSRKLFYIITFWLVLTVGNWCPFSSTRQFCLVMVKNSGPFLQIS